MRFSLILAGVASLSLAGAALGQAPINPAAEGFGIGPKMSAVTGGGVGGPKVGKSTMANLGNPNSPKTPVINGNKSSSPYVCQTPNGPKTPVCHTPNGPKTPVCQTPNGPKTPPINGSSTSCFPPANDGKPTVGKPSVVNGSPSFVARRPRW